MAAKIEGFALPTYKEIPAVGLYLEQNVKYINECLAPLGCVEITGSMVSNYVKKGYLPRPVKKQYGADHLAILLFIALAKQVLPMENVAKLLSLSPEEVSIQEAYTQLRERMHDALQVTFGYKAPTVRTAGMDDPSGILESLVIAVSHVIYLNHCFDLLSTGEKK